MEKYNTCTLPSGLRVIHLPSTGEVVYCGYTIAAGSRHEAAADGGLAHFCEHTTFKGTVRRRASQITGYLERVGGDLNAFTCKEDTTYHAAVPRQHAMRAVDLLSDIVFHSVYPQEEVEREVRIICDEIDSYEDAPADLIFDDFENIVFSGHPLGHSILGEAGRVRQFSRLDALRFTRRHYRPDHAVFFIYGDVDFRRLIRRLETVQPEAADCETDTLPCPTALPPLRSQRIERQRGTHQAHVMVGTRAFAATDPRRWPLYLLNNILGGPGMNARLNMLLRERHALVYSVDSTMLCYSDTGLWATYFGCDPEDVDRCLRLIHTTLRRATRQPLSASTLSAAKRQLKGQIGVATDNRENFALDFAKSFLHHGQERDIATLYRRIDSVTAEEIQQVAEQVFDPGRLTTLVYK